MSDQQRPDGPDATAPPPRQEREGGPAAGADETAHSYAERRRGWIKTHARDDRFLIFIAVVAMTAILSYVGYKLIEEYTAPVKQPPVPIAQLFYGAVEELEDGLVRASYDFEINPKIRHLTEACPQIRDWTITGTVDNQGILVSGDGRYRPFFSGDHLSLECDAALIFGRRMAIDFRSIYDGQEDHYYQFELNAGSKGVPAVVQITQWQGGSRRRSSDLVEIESLQARRDPPLFYRVKFELSRGTLRGYFGPRGGELKLACQMPADPELRAGVVHLRGPGSQTAFDNVVIAGRPHQEFVAARTKIYRLFQANRKRRTVAGYEEPPPPETAPPLKD